MTPAEFLELLQHKKFTNGTTDRPRVSSIYTAAFMRQMRAATRLDFGHLRWQDKEAMQLSRVIATGVLVRLQHLDLDGHRISKEGFRALAAAVRLGTLPSISKFFKTSFLGNDGVDSTELMNAALDEGKLALSGASAALEEQELAASEASGTLKDTSGGRPGRPRTNTEKIKK